MLFFRTDTPERLVEHGSRIDMYEVHGTKDDPVCSVVVCPTIPRPNPPSHYRRERCSKASIFWVEYWVPSVFGITYIALDLTLQWKLASITRAVSVPARRVNIPSPPSARSSSQRLKAGCSDSFRRATRLPDSIIIPA